MRLMKPLCIRKCGKEDIVRVGQFYDEVIRQLDARINYPRWIYKVYPGEDSVRKMVDAGGQYLCQEGEALLAAFALDARPQAHFRKGNWSRDLPEGSCLVLHALAVGSQNHGRGIGAEILRFCIQRAKAENRRAIRVDIVPTNVPARRFFEKNGFVYAGDVESERNIGGIPAFSLYELNL